MQIQNANLIKKWEGLRLESYQDTGGVWTIGYGHTKGVGPNMRITEAQAEKYLYEDIAWVDDAINRLVKVPLNQNQYDALGSFVFNIGATQFSNSTLLRKLNAGDYAGAADQFPRWKYDDGVVIQGLVNRRADEMALFESAEYRKTPPTRVDEVDPLKSMVKSKELWLGSGSVLTGVGTLLGGLTPDAQQTLSVALSVALVGFGAWFIYNRIVARQRGER